MTYQELFLERCKADGYEVKWSFFETYCPFDGDCGFGVRKCESCKHEHVNREGKHSKKCRDLAWDEETGIEQINFFAFSAYDYLEKKRTFVITEQTFDE